MLLPDRAEKHMSSDFPGVRGRGGGVPREPNFTFFTVSPRADHRTSLLGEIRSGGQQIQTSSDLISSKLMSFSTWSHVSTWELWPLT